MPQGRSASKKRARSPAQTIVLRAQTAPVNVDRGGPTARRSRAAYTFKGRVKRLWSADAFHIPLTSFDVLWLFEKLAGAVKVRGSRLAPGLGRPAERGGATPLAGVPDRRAVQLLLASAARRPRTDQAHDLCAGPQAAVGTPAASRSRWRLARS